MKTGPGFLKLTAQYIYIYILVVENRWEGTGCCRLHILRKLQSGRLRTTPTVCLNIYTREKLLVKNSSQSERTKEKGFKVQLKLRNRSCKNNAKLFWNEGDQGTVMQVLLHM